MHYTNFIIFLGINTLTKVSGVATLYNIAITLTKTYYQQTNFPSCNSPDFRTLVVKQRNCDCEEVEVEVEGNSI